MYKTKDRWYRTRAIRASKVYMRDTGSEAVVEENIKERVHEDVRKNWGVHPKIII